MRGNIPTPIRVALMFWIVPLMLYAMSPWYEIHFNATDSLPHRVYVVDKTNTTPSKGATFALVWRGGYGYKPGTTLLKTVYGLPGDRIEHQGRNVVVAGARVASALEISPLGRPLSMVPQGVVAQGQVFLATPSKMGFDSRYDLFGTVQQTALLGRAYAIY